MFKTQAHADLYPAIPKDKVRIVPNGIQPDHFTDVDKSPSAQGSGGTKKEANLIINTSSADRSLSACLEIFAEVKKQVPEARMEWAYGWQIFDNAHGNNKRMMEWKAQMQARMQELGVVERGRLNTKEVARLYQRAHVFLYPTAFYEIFCISALKAQLAGAYPVVSDFAALAEVVQWGTKMLSTVDKDTWTKAVSI
jgi:glycosyltransferase involved in cell wall biosynthesis